MKDAPCPHKDSCITGPPAALPLRAVSRNVHKVGFHGPYRIAEKLIYIRIGALKGSRGLHIRIHCHRPKLCISQINISFNFYILEPKDTKTGLIYVFPLFTDIFDLLRYSPVLIPLPRIDISLSKVAFSIKCFPMPDCYFLPFLSIQFKT